MEKALVIPLGMVPAWQGERWSGECGECCGFIVRKREVSTSSEDMHRMLKNAFYHDIYPQVNNRHHQGTPRHLTRLLLDKSM